MPTDGVVAVNKPQGVTSHDVVNRLRRTFSTRRIGHTGTLDPLATGVLVICVGQATRIAEYLTASDKEYIGDALLGVQSDTQDITGDVVPVGPAAGVTPGMVEAALAALTGEIIQVPPMTSARRHDGKRLYELAHRGIEVEREGRPVTIHEAELLAFKPGETASVSVRIRCSTGTYIRTLFHDLGAALGVGGCMSALVRTRAGAFTIGQALTLEELADGDPYGRLRPIAEALPVWPTISLDDQAEALVRNGMPTPVSLPDADRCLALAPGGTAVALGRVADGCFHPFKVFPLEEGQA